MSKLTLKFVVVLLFAVRLSYSNELVSYVSLYSSEGPPDERAKLIRIVATKAEVILTSRIRVLYGYNDDTLVISYFANADKGIMAISTVDLKTQAITQVRNYSIAEIIPATTINDERHYQTISLSSDGDLAFFVAADRRPKVGSGRNVVFKLRLDKQRLDIAYDEPVPQKGPVGMVHSSNAAIVYNRYGKLTLIPLGEKASALSFSGLLSSDLSRLPSRDYETLHRYIFVPNSGLFVWSREGFVQQLSGANLHEVKFTPEYSFGKKLFKVRSATYQKRPVLLCAVAEESGHGFSEVLIYDPSRRHIVTAIEIEESHAQDFAFSHDSAVMTYLTKSGAYVVYNIDEKKEQYRVPLAYETERKMWPELILTR